MRAATSSRRSGSRIASSETTKRKAIARLAASAAERLRRILCWRVTANRTGGRHHGPAQPRHRLVAAEPLPRPRRAAATSPASAPWPGRTSTLTPSPTPRRSRCRSTRPPPAWPPRRSNARSPRPSSRPSAVLPRLQQMRSLSKFGLSQVVVVFEDGTDIYFARQLIDERLGICGRCPPASARPTLGPVATGLGEVFHYLVYSKKDQPDRDLRTHLKTGCIKPALRTDARHRRDQRLGRLREAVPHPHRPRSAARPDLGFDQVVQAVRDNDLSVGGGMQQAGEGYLVHGVGRDHTTDRSATSWSHAAHRRADPPQGRGRGRGRRRTPPGRRHGQGRGEVVLGLGFMLMGENSHAVTRRLKKKFADAKKSLPRRRRGRTVYDRTG